MRRTKRQFILIFLACILAGFALPECHAADPRVPGTEIRGFRFSVKGNQTRLIFDAAREQPKQVGPASADGISVFFTQITARMADKMIDNPASEAKEVKFRRESGFLEVIFRNKNVTVTSTLQGGKAGKYTLILDLTAPKNKAPADSAAVSTEPVKPKPPIESKKVDTADLFGSRVPQDLKGVRQGVGKAEADRPPFKSTFEPMDEHAADLFQAAKEKFDNCSRDLVLCGPQVIEAYSEALRAGPKSSNAPTALYRMGLAYFTMGNYVKAEKIFNQVTTEWPDQSVASRCWIGMGSILKKKQAYMEAMEAFRSALRYASEKEDKAAASYELGAILRILGANKDALEFLNNCLGLDPQYYKKTPDILRQAGEAEFALGLYDKAKEHLLRHVNDQESGPDLDMVMAKLGEIFLIQGDGALAQKMYGFVAKYYTGSEGDMVCRIRQGELLEKSDPKAALEIYKGLRNKDLSPSLRKIVLLKLAALHLKMGEAERGLALMDEAFPVKSSDGGAEAGYLRERALGDLVEKYYAEKKFVSIVQLHDKYRRVFDAMQSADILVDIAESYAASRLYQNALEIYDHLLSKGQKKGDDVNFKCALYALRTGDSGKVLQYCKLVSDALDIKKSEVLGHVSARDQKYGDAVKLFAKTIQGKKDFELTDPDSLQTYGYSLFRLKKFDEAIPVLQKGLEQVKSEDLAGKRMLLVSLSKCYGEIKQYSKAAELLEAALPIAKEEEQNDLTYELSKLYLASGQPDKAVQSLREIMSRNNPFWSAVAEQQMNSIQMAQKN
jgi:tetratricopeptide (TPR) repeat protein